MTDDSLTTASTEVLVHECTTLAAQIASATCRFLLVVAELDRREAWAEWGCKSMAHFLSWQCSLAQGTARDHVRVAGALRSLPVMTGAFSRGELSYSKVRALGRVATPTSEADLVDLARIATAAHLDKIVRATVAAMTDPAKREELRELHAGWDDDGMATMRLRMRPDEAAIVDAAIDAAMPTGVSAETPVAARRLDAFVRICESYLATGDAARPGDDRYSVVVHAEIDESGLVSATTEQGGALHPTTFERIACDSSRWTIVQDRLEPLGSGRRSRAPSRAMRRAIRRRSGGTCEWTGCSERRYVEIHHVIPWSRGGPTEWWNLVALCWHHHHLVHEGGFSLQLDRATSNIRCLRPDGTELTNPIPVLAPPLDVAVDDDAIVPLWAGERFDLSACVDAVLYVRTG